jgi:multidrug efflux system membrane fusion protein
MLSYHSRFSKFLGLITLFLVSCQSQPPPQPFERAMPVVTAQVKESDVPIYLEVIGNIYSPQTVQVRAQVSGKLLNVHVQEGQEVKKGDLLFDIEPASYQASLDRADAMLKKNEATAEFAKRKFESHEPLVKREFVSRINYEQYATDVKTHQAQCSIDRAEVNLARINLEHCKILAPIDGRVSQHHVTAGNLVGPHDATPLIAIRQVAPLYVNFYLSQEDFQQLKTYDKKDLNFTITLSNQAEQKGQVIFIDNHFDLSTGSILLKGELSNQDRSLWPGEFVKVRLLVRTVPKAKLIPLAAIQRSQEGPFIYIVKPDLCAEMRLVKPIGHFEHYAILEQDVLPDERVVVDGQINLHDGCKVIFSPTEPEKTSL